MNSSRCSVPEVVRQKLLYADLLGLTIEGETEGDDNMVVLDYLGGLGMLRKSTIKPMRVIRILNAETMLTLLSRRP